MRNNIFNWMKLSSFIFALSILFVSCNQDEMFEPDAQETIALRVVVGDFPAFGGNAQTRASNIGVPDAGKTHWVENDEIIISVKSEKYGTQYATLTYNGEEWCFDDYLKYLEGENEEDGTLEVTALYAPCYEVLDDAISLKEGKTEGMDEYLEVKCHIENRGVLQIPFSQAKRNYSRIRIACASEVKSIFIAAGRFTPAGIEKEYSEVFYNETPFSVDENGNAYIYGSFGKNDQNQYGWIYVEDWDIEHIPLIDYYYFTKATEPGKSYALDARPKYFSISAMGHVIFAPGNLQYHPANNEWRFAESQTDYIGETNFSISSSYDGWIDSFGWSGNTGVATFGVSTSEDYNDYSGTFVDWGTNQIGDNAPNTWRTLSKDEWVYLFKTRTNADLLYGIAQVKGVNGMVVLPDNWETPTGLTFKSGQQGWDDDYSNFQSFTAEQWSEMEKAGALFLPANGFRKGTTMDAVVGYAAYYWSSTEVNSEKAYYMFFDYMDLFPQSNFSRSRGCSVRLVKDL